MLAEVFWPLRGVGGVMLKYMYNNMYYNVITLGEVFKFFI